MKEIFTFLSEHLGSLFTGKWRKQNTPQEVYSALAALDEVANKKAALMVPTITGPQNNDTPTPKGECRGPYASLEDKREGKKYFTFRVYKNGDWIIDFENPAYELLIFSNGFKELEAISHDQKHTTWQISTTPRDHRVTVNRFKIVEEFEHKTLKQLTSSYHVHHMGKKNGKTHFHKGQDVFEIDPIWIDIETIKTRLEK